MEQRKGQEGTSSTGVTPCRRAFVPKVMRPIVVLGHNKPLTCASTAAAAAAERGQVWTRDPSWIVAEATSPCKVYQGLVLTLLGPGSGMALSWGPTAKWPGLLT